jgi:transcriptional regulator with XRE-family HTH domain
MRIMPKSAQIVAARGLLGLEQRQLAELAGISPSTLVRIERARWKTAPGHTATVDRVVAVLEKKGVKFTEMGVELTRKPR